jgi:hypothetical protein
MKGQPSRTTTAASHIHPCVQAGGRSQRRPRESTPALQHGSLFAASHARSGRDPCAAAPTIERTVSRAHVGQACTALRAPDPPLHRYGRADDGARSRLDCAIAQHCPCNPQAPSGTMATHSPTALGGAARCCAPSTTTHRITAPRSSPCAGRCSRLQSPRFRCWGARVSCGALARHPAPPRAQRYLGSNSRTATRPCALSGCASAQDTVRRMRPVGRTGCAGSVARDVSAGSAVCTASGDTSCGTSTRAPAASAAMLRCAAVDLHSSPQAGARPQALAAWSRQPPDIEHASGAQHGEGPGRRGCV